MRRRKRARRRIQRGKRRPIDTVHAALHIVRKSVSRSRPMQNVVCKCQCRRRRHVRAGKRRHVQDRMIILDRERERDRAVRHCRHVRERNLSDRSHPVPSKRKRGDDQILHPFGCLGLRSVYADILNSFSIFGVIWLINVEFEKVIRVCRQIRDREHMHG